MNLEPQIKLVYNFVERPDLLFERLKQCVVWDERLKSRKTASFGVAYNYSGMTYPQTEMLDELIFLCEKISQEIGFMPNNCLLNYYLDGNSKMGYHSDNSAELKPGTGVVIVSLGAECSIAYRHKLEPAIKYKYLLNNGSLLYMDNDIQESWLHTIPKQQAAAARISLTFRLIDQD
ncbi:MAG: alpha-ketoglutarate-dependent dioxygenase AlkB [Cyanobacteria bacterium J06600_6]